MKVVVTGGTGFIGRHLVWHLVRSGLTVVFTGRNGEAAQRVLAHCPPQASATGQVSWVALDHGQPGSARRLYEATAGASAVVHCAARSSPWGPEADFVRANLVSTDEVIAAAEAHGVERLVHISTPSVYFDFSDRLNISECAPLPLPVNTYARTKALAEQRLQASVVPQRVILRPRAVFGPWDNTLMPRLLRVMARGPLPLMRGGRALLDLTYIDNVIHAIDLALRRPLPTGLGIYNLSNGEPLTLVALLAQVAEAFALPLRTRALPWPLVREVARLLELGGTLSGREPLLTRYSAGVLAFSQTLDLSAIRRDLGYSTQVSLSEGIRRHAQWHLCQPHGEQS